MGKRKLKSIFTYLLVLSSLFSFAPFQIKDTSGASKSAPVPAALTSFTQGEKNDFFTSPAGIFITEEADGRVIYAADKNMGILKYGSGGSIEKIFKRDGREYKEVFVYRHFIITLENNRLAFFDTQGEARPQTDFIASDPDGLYGAAFTDIYLDGDTLWGVAADSLYEIGITVSGGAVSLASRKVYGGGGLGLKNITSVAAAGPHVLLSADRNYEKALYLYDFINAPSLVKDFPDGINDITAYAEGGKYYAAAAHQNSVTRFILPNITAEGFSPPSNILSEGGIRSASFLHAYGGELYVCDADSRAVIILTLPELRFKEVLFSSQGGEPGRLYRPEGVCVWDDKLFIADSGNRRVQVWDKDGGITVFGDGGQKPLRNPTAVTVDALGRIFVADDYVRVIKYGADYGYISSFEFSEARITGIAAAADGVVYASDSRGGKVWAADAGDDSLGFSAYCEGIERPVSVCASLNLTSVYALKEDGGLVRLDKGAGGIPSVKTLGIENITAFTADSRDNIIALSRDPGPEKIDIIRFAKDESGNYTEEKSTSFPLVYEYGAYDIRHMAFSPVTGAVYMTNTAQSRIHSLSAADTGAVPFSDAERLGYESHEPLRSYAAARLAAQTPLYGMPLVSKAAEILPRGAEVTVLERDLSGNDYYSFVYLPSQNSAGYVLKTLLEPDNAPDTPPFAEGRIFNDDTPVYKFPSRLAPRVHNAEGELKLPRDKKVALVPYSKAADAGPEKWYCIELDGGYIGFVSALNVANYKYQPTKTVLSTNADIVKSNADGGAFMYEKDGVTLMDVPPLADGCRVKVVGSFKANAKFTEVIYQDAEFGLIQGYILTKYIKYDTTTNLQFVMLALLIALAVAAAAAVYIFQRKKTRVKR